MARFTAYDKHRLRKWADCLAVDILNNGQSRDPFGMAAKAMIRDARAVARDIGGEVTADDIKRFFAPGGEYK
jgi:hypothetical protein